MAVTYGSAAGATNGELYATGATKAGFALAHAMAISTTIAI